MINYVNNYNLKYIKFNKNILLNFIYFSYHVNNILKKILFLYLYSLNVLVLNKININFLFINLLYLNFKINFIFNISLYHIKNINTNEYYLLNLIEYYIKKNIGFKIIFKNIINILIKYNKIKGFKIIFKGRYKESLRKIKKNFHYGNINTQTLKFKIKKIQTSVLTEYGSIGVKLIINKF